MQKVFVKFGKKFRKEIRKSNQSRSARSHFDLSKNSNWTTASTRRTNTQHTWDCHGSTIASRVDMASDHSRHLLSFILGFECVFAVKVGHMAGRLARRKGSGFHIVDTTEEHRRRRRGCKGKRGDQNRAESLHTGKQSYFKYIQR